VPSLDALLGGRYLLAGILYTFYNSFNMPVVIFLILLLLMVLLRKRSLAMAGFVVILLTNSVAQFSSASHPGLAVINAAATVLTFSVVLIVLFRYGFLALTASAIFANLATELLPLPLDSGAWWLGRALVPQLLAAALLLYGFAISLGGQGLFKSDLLQD
jgi:hypothetical protein